MSRSIFSIILIALTSFPLFAQIAVGQWRDHLPYNNGVQVADAGDWMYSASKSGLFKYHKQEGDIVRLSKVNGMSDIGYSAIAWSDANNTLIVAYSNTNIDLIQDGAIINVPDIKDKSILGNKTINNIHIKDDYAYLACGFAIVVLDIVKHEVKDTYYIGPDGAVLNVFDITTSETEIFACTEAGVYHAQLSNPNLANFENWQRYSELAEAKFNTGAWFNDRLYVNRTTEANDTIFYLQNNVWMPFDTIYPDDIYSLETTESLLLITAQFNVSEYDMQHERQRLIFEYDPGTYGFPKHAIHDQSGRLWVSDGIYGLVRINNDWSGSIIHVNGPSGISNFDMSIWDGRCYVASGGITSVWSNQFNSKGLYSYKDDQWQNINANSFPETEELRDYIRVLVDPFDSRRVYATAWGRGLVEYYDDQFVELYDTSNSTLQGMIGHESNVRVSGIEIDRNTGSLWVGGSGSDDLLFAKTQEGEWYSFHIDGIGPITLSDIAIDNIGQKWIVAPRGVGVVVFNDNGTLANNGDDQSRKLTQNLNNGNLASNNVFCIAADFDGEIWVGTDNGISVFYSPESAFSGGNYDSQQILIEQDGYVQYLLENEGVKAIAIDGANRKWIATSNAGVFLLSEDGTEEILHFTKDNSPLFSDEVTSLAIDHLSGEVFIGTDKGIVSYRGTATWGTPEFEPDDVYAYPNPVEPDYEGPIAIKGLVRDADVKITDVAGNVVFATIADGGQAIWDGKNFSGARAKSGVYLVFASNEDGKQTFVTKVLFIN